MSRRGGEEGHADGARHLTPELLDAVFAGERSGFEVLRLVVDHLEAECPQCRGALAAAPFDHRGAIDLAEERLRADSAALERERRELPALLAELEAVGAEEGFLRVAEDRRFHTVAFVQERLERAHGLLEEAAPGPAGEALDLGQLAAHVLEAARYGPVLVRRLKAQAWLLRALGAIVRGVPDEAEEALEAAVRLARGSGRGRGLRAALLYARARLNVSEGRPERASRLLERADFLLGRPDEEVREGAPEPGGFAGWWHWPVRTELAALDRAEGRPEAAVERLREAPRRPERPAEWNALRELLRALLEAGRSEEVEQIADALVGAPVGGGTAAPARAAQAALLRGRALRRLGHVGAAEEKLARARRELLFLGRGVPAAEATVELARLLRASGRHRRARELLADLEPFTACPDVTGGQLAALSRCAGVAARSGTSGSAARSGTAGSADPFEEALGEVERSFSSRPAARRRESSPPGRCPENPS